MPAKPKPQKTIRFTRVVETAGHPVPLTLWTAPEDDPEFSKAIQEQRVLTVIQRNVGAKADYGLVGFFKEPLATYLVFPKKLENPPETKVVGIKYEELAEAKPRGPVQIAKPKRVPGVTMREKRSPATERREPESATTAQPKRESAPAEVESTPAAKPEPPLPPVPKLHPFHADVAITARQRIVIEVQARSAAEAARLLKEKASELELNLPAATVTRRVSKPKKTSG